MNTEAKEASVKAFIWTFVGLMVLLGLTYWAAYLPFGKWSIVVAMAIAGAKAALVGLFFMQLRYRSGLVRVFALGGVFWLSVLFILSFADYMTRGG